MKTHFYYFHFHKKLRLCLVPVKYLPENKIFFENAIFEKGKYFQMFGCIMKIVVENIFMCLVIFWKCYFPPSPTQNRPPHNRKTTKTPPQQQQKSKSHRNQNHTQREIGSWISGEVEGSRLPEGSRSKIGGSKALALGRRLWVRGVIWALGSLAKSKIGSWVHGFMAGTLGRRRSWRLVGRRLWVEDRWVEGSGSRSKALGS